MSGVLSTEVGADTDPERSAAVLPAGWDRLGSVYAVAAEGGAATVAVRFGGSRLTLTWANAAALDLLGLPLSALGEQELLFDRTVSRDRPSYWMVVVAETLAGPDAARLGQWQSATVDSQDGTTSIVQLMVTATAGADKVVWLRSVTEAERVAEEAQRESEHRFLALAEHAPVGIVVSEAGVRLGFVNNRFAQIVGSDRSALVGTQWLNMIYPEDLPALLETLEEVLSGSAVETTVRLVSVTDSQRWVQLRLSPVTTPRRSAGFIGTVEDITARRAWEAQLAYQANHDALTGLANRRSLVEQLSVLLDSRRSRDRGAAVLFCDLDGFKEINDTLGHDAGDRVLIEVGQRLSSTARDHDLVARMAGDEFVVMIREIDGIADAEAAAGRLLQSLTAAIRVGGRPLHISASIGIAMARDHDNATTLLQAADRGMYEAKRAGGGLYRGGVLDVRGPGAS